jgi:hypothetical protein
VKILTVTPAFNEAENIRECYKRFKGTLSGK